MVWRFKLLVVTTVYMKFFLEKWARADSNRRLSLCKSDVMTRLDHWPTVRSTFARYLREDDLGSVNVVLHLLGELAAFLEMGGLAERLSPAKFVVPSLPSINA